MLIQMGGFPGSGKSTISKEVAKRVNGIVLDRDVVKTCMIKSGLDHENASKISYDMVYELAAFYLEQNRIVFIDTPCYYDEIINTGMSIANKYQVPYRFLECFVESFDIIEDRIHQRNNMLSQITSSTKESFENAKKHAKRPSNNFLQIDTSNFDKIDYDKILHYLK